MTQNKRTVKLLVVFGIIAVLAMAGIAAFAFQGDDFQGANAPDGQLTVTRQHVNPASMSPFSRPATNDGLIELIARAESLLATTDLGPGGTGTHHIPTAQSAVYNTLVAELAAARTLADNTRMFRVNEELDLVVDITGNTGGFAGMMLRIDLPARLHLVSVTPGPMFRYSVPSPAAGQESPSTFVGPPGWVPEFREDGSRSTNPFTFFDHTLTSSQPDDARPRIVIGTNVASERTVRYFGWGGRFSGNYTGDGVLVTIRVRVLGTPVPTTRAGVNTGNINISFANAQGSVDEVPVRSIGVQTGGSTQNLVMSIQGVTSPKAATPANLGIVNIRRETD